MCFTLQEFPLGPSELGECHYMYAIFNTDMPYRGTVIANYGLAGTSEFQSWRYGWDGMYKNVTVSR
jgi:hypothetical protein